MTRRSPSEFDDSTEQSEEIDLCLETAEDKALEALKQNNPEKDCNVTVRAHNRDHDSDRNVTDHLIQTGDEWIAFRTWSEIGGGTSVAVKDHGETLQLEAPELDHDDLADHICSEALDAIDAHAEADRPVKPFTVLIRNVADVTEDLVTRWQNASEYIVSERIYEGNAGWTGRTAWTAHEDEAMYIEADSATMWFINEHLTDDVSDDVEATILNIFVQSLYDAVADHRGRRSPHLEFAAKVTLTVTNSDQEGS